MDEFNGKNDMIVILDFGSQYTHLICRRIREQKVYAEILPYNISADTLKSIKPKGIILSGSPSSVYEPDAPLPDTRILELGIPVLGICYGHQLIVHMLGGLVRKAKREYGNAELMIDDSRDLFMGIKERIRCWMSHGDAADRLPEGFEILAHTDNSYAAAVAYRAKRIYGLQFHPEVMHTEHGSDILRNFAVGICRAEQSWSMNSFIEEAINDIKEKTGGERVLAAVSGGIDSTVTALLVHRAIGDRLTCVFINHGLLREGEESEVQDIFNTLGMRLNYIDASDRFLDRLKGVADPEMKRLLIGEEFARVFTEFVDKHGPFTWLAQGTLYPDVIESGNSVSKGTASTIKSHHNVAGLPSWLNLKVLEPLRYLYKDEVRELAKLLEVPERFIKRHPFPGPGLAVRIIGAVTEEKLRICKRASRIIEEELLNAGLYDKVWQAFAIVGDDRAVGVLGDARVYGNIVGIRIVESIDAMTADWVRLPYDVLARMSNRITNEVEGVTWVTYVVSSKPPATIEPQ